MKAPVVVVMSEYEQQPSARGFSSRQKFASALQVIRKNAVYRSIVMRLGHAADTPKKCKNSPTRPAAAATATDDGGFGDWRTDGLPEHSHRRPSPPCAVSRSVSDYGVVRPSARRQHVSDTKRVEEAYRRGFCDGSVADVFLAQRRQTCGFERTQQRPVGESAKTADPARRRRPSSAEFADGSPWTTRRLTGSSTVPAGLASAGAGDRHHQRVSPTPRTAAAAPVVVHRSLPASASRVQRHRRLSLPVSADGGSPHTSPSGQTSVDMESPSATVPTRAAAIALHQLIECYRNGYRVTDHKIALMLDILDTQQRLAKVKRNGLRRRRSCPSPGGGGGRKPRKRCFRTGAASVLAVIRDLRRYLRPPTDLPMYTLRSHVLVCIICCGFEKVFKPPLLFRTLGRKYAAESKRVDNDSFPPPPPRFDLISN